MEKNMVNLNYEKDFNLLNQVPTITPMIQKSIEEVKLLANKYYVSAI